MKQTIKIRHFYMLCSTRLFLLKPTTRIRRAALFANLFLVARLAIAFDGVDRRAEFFAHLHDQGAHIGAIGVVDQVVGCQYFASLLQFVQRLAVDEQCLGIGFLTVQN